MKALLSLVFAATLACAQAPAPPADPLAAHRARIDEIDAQLVELLNQRAEVVLAIGALKRETGKAVRDPAREALVHEKLHGRNSGPLANDALSRIWERIMAEMRALQE